MPQLEGASASAVVNGRIHVIGSAVHGEYNPATNGWTARKPMPTPRSHFGIAVYRDRIYTIGSYGSSCANEVYDPSTDTWETKKPMPTNRTSITAAVAKGRIHLFSMEGHDIYDIASDFWTEEAMPYGDFGMGSVAFGGRIYVFSWNRTQIYDVETGTWSLGMPSPIRVSSAGVCKTTGVMGLKRIYVFGGSPSFLDETDATQAYDPINDSWTLGEPMPTKRAGLDAVAVNDVIYAIGGGYGWGYTANVNEQYFPFGYGSPDPSYDGVPPEITIVTPKNTTCTRGSIPLSLNFTVDKPAEWIGCCLDGQKNVTVAGNTTLSGLSEGCHNVTVYAEDEAGNVGASETVCFSVAEPFPLVPVAAASAIVALVVVGLLLYFKKRKG